MFKLVRPNTNQSVTIYFNGAPLTAFENETVAAALLRQGKKEFRTTPVKQQKRLPFCMMGTCYDCLLTIDDLQDVQGCATYVRDGMQIKTQHINEKQGSDHE
ncbi:(2Fe-2S)-binding protein [Terasakiella pusilla]|uniref:(2Fe-2S)-binding protein n=1 Tax=Terasakiella pusilla TaxID=64973 RepID=UPI00048C6DD8|nr:(2Fe-2S)-binding protein [Terasakiella pusilla]